MGLSPEVRAVRRARRYAWMSRAAEAVADNIIFSNTLTYDLLGGTLVNSPTAAFSAAGMKLTNNGVSAGLAYWPIKVAIGKRYQITVDIVYGGAGFARVEIANSVPSSAGGSMINRNSSGVGITATFTASVATVYLVTGNRNDNNAFHTYKNLVVRRI